MAAWTVCEVCGALVADTTTHDAWHTQATATSMTSP